MSRSRPRTRLPRTVPVGQMRRNLRAVQHFRLNFVFFALIAMYVVLLGRLGKLQVVDAATLREEAGKNQRGRLVFRGLRGRILDARDRTLVTSRQDLSLAVDMVTLFEKAPDAHTAIGDFARTLASLLDEQDGGRRIAAILAKASPRDRHVPLGPPLEEERLLRTLAPYADFGTTLEAGLGGLKVQVGECRTYPNGDYAMHVLGRAPDRDCGRRGCGIEGQCHADLVGGRLTVPYRRGYRGRGMISASLDPLEASGRDVRLTLDIVVQHYVESALDAAMEKWQATEGCAIVLDPQTGHVLAMVSRPLSAPNFATLALWAPGSLFKPLTVALALEGGYVTPDEVFDLSSPHVFHTPSVRKSRPVRDSHPIGAGAIDDILVHSSNIGVSMLLWRMIHGPGWAASDAVPSYDRALAFLRAVGLYGPTGLELADDVHRPFLSEDHPNVLYPAVGWAFGKGFGTSPLKTLCAFAALARDDGRVVRPTLLAGRGGGRRDLEPIVPTAAHRHVVREALRGVVQRGTARRAFEGCTLDVAAKTGTAVFERTTRQIAGLIAFAPVERPRLAVLVMCNVDETTRHPDHGPHQQPSGGIVAGPPARAILERTFAYLDGRALAEAREALR